MVNCILTDYQHVAVNLQPGLLQGTEFSTEQDGENDEEQGKAMKGNEKEKKEMPVQFSNI